MEMSLSVKGQPGILVCATISAENSRIVTVDKSGKLRVWNAKNGASLAAVGSEISFRIRPTRGAFSRDGKYFLWTKKSGGDIKATCCGEWNAEVIDLAGRECNLQL